MANMICSYKSGSQWTKNELDAYNIQVVNIADERAFFAQDTDVDAVGLSELPRSVLECEDLEQLDDVNDGGYLFMSLLDMATDPDESEQSAVDDFARELLRMLGFQGQERVIRTRKHIDFLMCGQPTRAETDVCILNRIKIFLLLQEDKAPRNSRHPAPTLIAEVVAAFQYNNNKRSKNLGLDTLEECVFPGITMVGAIPVFYKIKVTKSLDNAIQRGEYPEKTTIVERFNPFFGRHPDWGLNNLSDRKRVLKCFKLFKLLMPFKIKNIACATSHKNSYMIIAIER